MNIRLRRALAASSAVVVMATGMAVLNPVAAHAEQNVDIVVSGEVYRPGTDIVDSPDGEPALLCDAQNPMEKYEVAFQGILEMKSVWKKYGEMVGLASLGAIFRPDLAPDNLVLEGEWTTSMQIDPAQVEIARAMYTKEAVQARFDAANAETGKDFADMMRVQSAEVTDDGTFTAVYKLQTKQADGTYTDNIKGVDLKKPTAKPERVVFPSLDDSLYVTADKVEALSKSGEDILAKKPTVTGQMRIPRIQYIYAAGINNYTPINFVKGVGNDVAVKPLIKPFTEVLNRTVADGQELPDEIIGMNLSRVGEIGSDPDAALNAPEKTEFETTAGTWKFAGYESVPDRSAPCGKRVYWANWQLERLVTPKSPVALAPQCGVNKRIEWERIDGVSYVETKREGTMVTMTAEAAPGYKFPEGSQHEWVIDITADPCPVVAPPANEPKPIVNPKAEAKTAAAKVTLAKTGADASVAAGLAALFAMAGAVALRGRKNG